MNVSRELIDSRLWPNVRRGNADECWPWMRSKHPDGHGQFGIRTPSGQRMFKAHREAFASANGVTLTPGAIVGHTCGNPACCNPGHLEASDPLRLAAGRRERGTHHAPSEGFELTDAEVAAALVMRAEKHSIREIAAHIGRSYGAVRQRLMPPSPDARTKLSDDQVRAVRKRRARGSSLSELAAEFGVGESTISRICRGVRRGRIVT